MPRPNLFIVGAPKCGTTAWVEYLGTHPEIFFPKIKEPHYFAFDLPGMRQVSSEKLYSQLFKPAATKTIIGEASVLYLYSEAAASAIHGYNPAAKIIMFLRAQEEYLPSVHHQYLYDFRESLDFEQAWRLSGQRGPETIPATCTDTKLLDYVSLGNFEVQVDRYLSTFPHEQIKIIEYDKWIADPRATYLEIMDFLGLADDGRSDFPRVNVAKKHKFKLLGRLIYHPPRLARWIVDALKRLTGKTTLGLAKRAARAIEVPGYTTKVDSGLKEEIRTYYAEQNRILRERISNAGTHRAGPST